MTRSVFPILLPLLLTGGCFEQETTPLVPDSPFGNPVASPPVKQTALSPPTSNVEAAARVDTVGRLSGSGHWG